MKKKPDQKKLQQKRVQRVLRHEGEWLETQYSGRTLGQRSLNKKRSSHEKKGQQRIEPLDSSEANATVMEVHPQLCRVRMDLDGSTPLCAYRRIGVYYHEFHGFRQRSPVSVGDRVKAKTFGKNDGVIEGICSRRNQLVRLAPGKEGPIGHVMAANLDILLILTSAAEPDFNPGIVDRFLVAAHCAGIATSIVVNKMDLYESDPKQGPWQFYAEKGIQLYLTSAKSLKGIHEIVERHQGQRVALCGHSGVGKTTLLNIILGRQDSTGEVNSYTGKGKHTTTGSHLYHTENGTQWIDTPGIKEFRLAAVSADQVRHCFAELQSLCSDPQCDHLPEKECPAQTGRRYQSYVYMLNSVLESEENA